MNDGIGLISILIIDLCWLTTLLYRSIISLNNKKEFIRTIKHELTHAYIFERFGFKKWNIKKTDNKGSMVCKLTISKNEIKQKGVLKILLLFSIQFIYDLGMPLFFIAIGTIVKNTRRYLSEIKQLIICIIKINYEKRK